MLSLLACSDPLQEREPIIHSAIRFGAVLENVTFDEVSGPAWGGNATAGQSLRPMSLSSAKYSEHAASGAECWPFLLPPFLASRRAARWTSMPAASQKTRGPPTQSSTSVSWLAGWLFGSECVVFRWGQVLLFASCSTSSCGPHSLLLLPCVQPTHRSPAWAGTPATSCCSAATCLACCRPSAG